ncbi:membrane protein [Neobacillus kokaensis]|uniref:Membrane protein n=1 Tax=Neobacillus kokaensis TaxID=2759023 RepID=A0ABQ3N5T8_9BACI|nr:membrane protein [Neobacillus kokaensis]
MNDQNEKSKVNYVQVEQSEQFQQFMNKRKKFIVPYTIFFLVFYFLLPICTSYTSFLNTPAIGDISWVWIFAFAQFVMTFVLCTVYVKKAGALDKEADQIIKNQVQKGGAA